MLRPMPSGMTEPYNMPSQPMLLVIIKITF